MKTSKHRYVSTIKLVLPRDLADLVPTFLTNRRSETSALLTAVAKGDFRRIDWIAQRMVGGGAMFGFDRITEIGRMIRCAVTSSNRRQIRQRVQEYAEYLDQLRVEYRGSEPALIRLSPEKAIEAPGHRDRSVRLRAPRRRPTAGSGHVAEIASDGH